MHRRFYHPVTFSPCHDLRGDRLWRAGGAAFAAALWLAGAAGAIGLLAVGDIPTAALEVNGRGAHAPLDIAAFARITGGGGGLGKRNTLFKVSATVVAHKFIDGHLAQLPTLSTTDKKINSS